MCPHRPVVLMDVKSPYPFIRQPIVEGREEEADNHQDGFCEDRIPFCHLADIVEQTELDQFPLVELGVIKGELQHPAGDIDRMFLLEIRQLVEKRQLLAFQVAADKDIVSLGVNGEHAGVKLFEAVKYPTEHVC